MIYTVNLISKDNLNQVTTTDITSYVETGFSVLEKLDETFDNGTMKLLNTNREEPYVLWDTIQVLIDGSEVSSLRIAGDSVSLASKNPKRYNHTLTLIEHTKLLELFVISGKTFTQPTDGTTKYSIADVLNILFRIAPLEIAELVKIAIADSTTITINEEFDDFVYPTGEFTLTATITQTEDFVNFIFPFSSHSETVTTTQNETFDTFINPSIAVSDSLLADINETFTNFIYPNINISDSTTVSVSETFINGVKIQVSDAISDTITVTQNETWYNDRPVEWVSGGSSTTPDQTCDSELDVNNVKRVASVSCSFVGGGLYSSPTDLTTSQPACSDGATYTVCTDLGGFYQCQDFTGNETTTFEYFTCTLKT